MLRWLEHAWLIFVLTLLYSLATFHLYWRYGPVSLPLIIGGALALPVLYGVLWFAWRSDPALAVSALAGSGAWVGAALFVVLAHYPPWLGWLGVFGGQPRSDLAEAASLVAPPLVALCVSVWQSRVMGRRLAILAGRRTKR